MTNELDALDPDTAIVTLSTGTQVQVARLKSRQFFKLLRIVTRGASPASVQSRRSRSPASNWRALT